MSIVTIKFSHLKKIIKESLRGAEFDPHELYSDESEVHTSTGYQASIIDNEPSDKTDQEKPRTHRTGVVSDKESDIESSDIVIIGDSQSAGNIGREIKSLFGDIPSENIFEKTGTTASGIIKSFPLLDRAIKHAKKIIIILGGNGSSGNADLAKMINMNGKSNISTWIGPPDIVKASDIDRAIRVWGPAARDQDLFILKRKPGRDRNRENARLSAESQGIMFIDPRDHMKSYSSSPDGIHASASGAKELVLGISDIIT